MPPDPVVEQFKASGLSKEEAAPNDYPIITNRILTNYRQAVKRASIAPRGAFAQGAGGRIADKADPQDPEDRHRDPGVDLGKGL